MASFLIHKYQIIKSVSENCYEDMEYRIWLKMYFLQSNIQLNRRVVSDDHGERFHQYINKMGKKTTKTSGTSAYWGTSMDAPERHTRCNVHENVHIFFLLLTGSCIMMCMYGIIQINLVSSMHCIYAVFYNITL